MGGLGSGRRDQNGKPTTNNHLALDIRKWQREGLIVDGKSFHWYWSRYEENPSSINVRVEAGYVRLKYRYRKNQLEWKNTEYLVYFNRTICNFGGTRIWFLCPTTGCGRRVAILYQNEGFACRRCHLLAYQSQREQIGHRAIRIAERIRKRLGWEPGVLSGDESKPKGMHKKTFEKLIRKHETLVGKVLEYGRQKFGGELF